MKSISSENILIKVPNWLGDVVLCLPALAAVRKSFPRSAICAIGNQTARDVLSLSGLDLEFVHFDRRGKAAGKISVSGRGIVRPRASGAHSGAAGGRPGTWRAALSALRGRGWNLGLTFAESFSSALLLRLAGAKRVVGYSSDSRRLLLSKSIPRHDLGSRPHAVREYMALVVAAGASPGKETPSLAMPGEILSSAGELLLGAGVDESKPLAGICPGAAYGATKRWPAERFRSLGRELANRGASVVVFGSPAEAEIAGEIAGAVPGAVSLAGRTTVAALAGCLSRCSVVIANDSGAAHLAAAVSTPVVAIFGSTDPAWTRPLGLNVTVVKAKEMPCAPCFGTECHQGYACLTGISEEEVISAALAVAAGALR